MTRQFKQDKGQAGLTILLSVVVMLFIIGLLVMIFSLMGSSVNDAIYTTTTVTVTNETVTVNATSNDTVATSTANQFVLKSITAVFNATGVSIPVGNVSFTSAGVLSQNPNLPNANLTWGNTVNVSYTYDYGKNNTATEVMSDTTTSLASSTDWFEIFIVITAMVVLILLTVIIITAIRSSGLVAGGESSGANTVGTA